MLSRPNGKEDPVHVTARAEPTWVEYVQHERLFSNAIRLRYLIWTIQQQAPVPARLLEVGFGSGATAVLLADLGYRVTALDLSAEVVRAAEKRYAHWLHSEQLEFQQADMRVLPWANRQFDIAYHQGVLEHCSDDVIVEALQEQRRVARWIIFDVPNIKYGAQPFGDERLLRVSHWRRLIARSGLTAERVLGRGFPRWAHVLPYAFFTREGVQRFPGITERLGASSIFVCRSE